MRGGFPLSCVCERLSMWPVCEATSWMVSREKSYFTRTHTSMYFKGFFPSLFLSFFSFFLSHKQKKNFLGLCFYFFLLREFELTHSHILLCVHRYTSAPFNSNIVAWPKGERESLIVQNSNSKLFLSPKAASPCFMPRWDRQKGMEERQFVNSCNNSPSALLPFSPSHSCQSKLFETR